MDRFADLLDQGVDPDAVRGQSATLLHAVLDEMSDGSPIDALILVLRRGADVEATRAPGLPPLVQALSTQLREAARSLLAAGTDPSSADDEGNTPLHLSVEQRDYEMVELLLRCGAKKTIERSGGPAGMSVLGYAACHLDVRMVQILLAAGADPDALDDDRLTPRDRMRYGGRTEEPARSEIEALLTAHRRG
jgi:uncharacterized protein